MNQWGKIPGKSTTKKFEVSQFNSGFGKTEAEFSCGVKYLCLIRSVVFTEEAQIYSFAYFKINFYSEKY